MEINKDMAAFFAIRACVSFFLALGYYVSIKGNIDYIQFFLTSFLLFTPFVLDYYPRECETENEMRVRKFGIRIPSVAIAITICIGILNGNIEFWTSNPHILIKICANIGALLIVFLTFLDYNDYNRRSDLAVKLKKDAASHIEQNKSEEVEQRFKRIQADKKNGIKELAIKSESKKGQKKKSKGA
ncbi:hypothetical protein JFL43_21870 [Viridibacillus sp. YIM B01967]|uniref:DUF1616 domain-containing protein n=1 Tax=Viridibacillus soli TaxID=2798301 RepID=A0ABS1HDC4_9BACL|nr:hypothetical protein [Viridibacillus soli]MBK3497410.1 hypothetical protein [Viridibacillus soli]